MVKTLRRGSFEFICMDLPVQGRCISDHQWQRDNRGGSLPTLTWSGGAQGSSPSILKALAEDTNGRAASYYMLIWRPGKPGFKCLPVKCLGLGTLTGVLPFVQEMQSLLLGTEKGGVWNCHLLVKMLVRSPFPFQTTDGHEKEGS